MIKRKFKVGDRVWMVRDFRIPELSKKLSIPTIGATGTVVSNGLHPQDFYVKFDGFENPSNVFDFQIEPLNEPIVIYRDGDKVIALDKSTGKKVEARCNPADEFDFHTGAKLAFSRLIGKPQEKKVGFEQHLILDSTDDDYGRIGDETSICDIDGRKLKVGDTVNLYNICGNGQPVFRGERSIVRNGYSEFVMGSKGSKFDHGVSNDILKLLIILKRQHTEVKDGETVGCIKYIKSERTGK